LGWPAVPLANRDAAHVVMFDEYETAVLAKRARREAEVSSA